MSLQFDPRSGTDVIRDSHGNWRTLLHSDRSCLMRSTSARCAAEDYLRQNQALLGLDVSHLRALDAPQGQATNDVGIEYRFLSEKRKFDVTTVTFRQTCRGLPVWRAGISVHLKDEPPCFRAIGCHTSGHSDLVPRDLPPAARLESLDSRELLQQLGLAGSSFVVDSLDIRHRCLMIYRYRAARRSAPLLTTALSAGKRRVGVPLPLPPVPAEIQDGQDYLVAAVYFDVTRNKAAAAHWVALIEAETLSVLYCERSAGGINGAVFLVDPMTANGGPPPSASNAELNPLRKTAALQGLDNAQPQGLTGTNVRIADFDPPGGPPPTEPAGADFVFDVRSDEFAAVNAYFHCDRFFNLVESLGFSRSEYFPETKFPIPVDHRGTPTTDLDGTTLDAQCRMERVVRQDGSEGMRATGA
jgi:zinc metalloprotease ZmpB